MVAASGFSVPVVAEVAVVVEVSDITERVPWVFSVCLSFVAVGDGVFVESSDYYDHRVLVHLAQHGELANHVPSLCRDR